MKKLFKNQVVTIVAAAALTMTLLFGAGGCSQKTKAMPTKEKSFKAQEAKLPTVKPSAASGQKIYNANCAVCHGTTGAGDGPKAAGLPKKPTNFTDVEVMRSIAPLKLYKAITNGEKTMPAFKRNLTLRERWDVLFFIWSRSTSPMQIAAGKNIFTKNCAVCHGRSGRGNGLEAPGMNEKPPSFNDPRFMMKESRKHFFKTVTGGENQMPSFSGKLNDDQRWNVVDYVWTFIYVPPSE